METELVLSNKEGILSNQVLGSCFALRGCQRGSLCSPNYHTMQKKGKTQQGLGGVPAQTPAWLVVAARLLYPGEVRGRKG